MVIRDCFFIIILCCLLPSAMISQNMIVGAHFSCASNLETENTGFGGGVKMGLLLFGGEMGFKAFYHELNSQTRELEAYGISAYSATKLLGLKELELHVYLEGGLAFSFREAYGSEPTTQIGVGPLLKYWVSNQLSVDLNCEYLLVGSIKTDTPSFLHLFIPSISFAVKI